LRAVIDPEASSAGFWLLCCLGNRTSDSGIVLDDYTRKDSNLTRRMSIPRLPVRDDDVLARREPACRTAAVPSRRLNRLLNLRAKH